MTASKPEKLLIVWTSGDKDVAINMVFMYARNSMLKGWGDEVTLLVWGPSTNLLVHDEELKVGLKEVQDTGVRVVACKRCAENYGVVPQMEGLGAEVIYSGEFFTDWIKSEEKYITF